MEFKNLFIISLFFILPIVTNAQQQPYPITVKKVPFGTYQFNQGANKMTLKEVIPIMQSNSEAFKLILKTQKTKNWFWGLGISGSTLMAAQILIIKEPNPLLLGASFGMLIATYPLLAKYGKQANQAANKYNSGLSSASNMYILKVGTTKNGISLILKF